MEGGNPDQDSSCLGSWKDFYEMSYIFTVFFPHFTTCPSQDIDIFKPEWHTGIQQRPSFRPIVTTESRYFLLFSRLHQFLGMSSKHLTIRAGDTSF